MSDMPERIWVAGTPQECGQYFPSCVEAEGELGGIGVEYVRADSIPAAQVTIKPLEWDQLEGLPDYDIWEVLTIIGRYKVQKASWNDYALLVRPNGTMDQFPTIESAKAAAQADYAARIRSALTATPAQDVAEIAARIKRIKDELLTRASAEPDDVAYAYRDAATALDVMFEYEPLARMKEAGE